jgi:hypothetical protein
MVQEILFVSSYRTTASAEVIMLGSPLKNRNYELSQTRQFWSQALRTIIWFLGYF